MKNRLALLFAVLGVVTLVCVLVASRDNKLQYQDRPQAPAAAASSDAPGLSPTIEPLAEPSAPEAPKAETPKPEADKQPLPASTALKAKG